MDIVFTTRSIRHDLAVEKAHTEALVTRIERSFWDEISKLGKVWDCAGVPCLHVGAIQFGYWLDKRADAGWHGHIHIG